MLDRLEFDRVMSKAAQLIRVRFFRQPADPLGDDHTTNVDNDTLTKRAVHQIFGEEFFEEESVRLVSNKILEQLLKY